MWGGGYSENYFEHDTLTSMSKNGTVLLKASGLLENRENIFSCEYINSDVCNSLKYSTTQPCVTRHEGVDQHSS